MRKSFCWSLERGDLLPVILMAPAVLLVFCVLVLPLCYGIFLSFFDFGFGGFVPSRDFVGLKHYAAFLRDTTALRAVANTLAFSAGAIAGDFVIGTAAAVLIFQLSRRVAAVVRPLVTVPLLISPIVVGLIWRYMYDPRGLVYWLLGRVGVTIDMFPGVTAASTALLSTVIAHWWQVVPFVVIVITAGLVSIPVELYEAAYADGAGAFTSFWRITFPLLREVYVVILLISGVDTIKVFDIVFALTGGGPNDSTVTTSIYAYSQGFSNSNLSYAMTISVVAMLVTFLVFGLPFIRHNRARAAR
ncbi:MAG TPA: sugar ABC transporter permease [Rectinemataceae bacterium]|nr:sugar ABC transporter permease [Rectinemataceae bacterium]